MPTIKRPQLVERDLEMLTAIVTHEGRLTVYQLRERFFPGGSLRTVEVRFEKLKRLGLTERATYQDKERTTHVYFAATRQGYHLVLEHLGLEGNALPYRGVRQAESLFLHDADINTVRLSFTAACAAHPELELTEWTSSTEFWRDNDQITFKIHNQPYKRKIIPDGFFIIQQPGENPSRFLLEVDRGTESQVRIAREKYHAGFAYLRSDEYERRFGFKAGRWLFIASTERRMATMREVIVQELGRAADVYYFTTIDKFRDYEPHGGKKLAYTIKDICLTAPIWYKGGAEEPTYLFESYYR